MAELILQCHRCGGTMSEKGSCVTVWQCERCNMLTTSEPTYRLVEVEEGRDKEEKKREEATER